MEFIDDYSQTQKPDEKIEGLVAAHATEIWELVVRKPGECIKDCKDMKAMAPCDPECQEARRTAGAAIKDGKFYKAPKAIPLCNTALEPEYPKRPGTADTKAEPEITEERAKEVAMDNQECPAIVEDKANCVLTGIDLKIKGQCLQSPHPSKDIDANVNDICIETCCKNKAKMGCTRECIETKGRHDPPDIDLDNRPTDPKAMGNDFGGMATRGPKANVKEAAPPVSQADDRGDKRNAAIKVQSFKLQKVDGTNYRIKLSIADKQYEVVIHENPDDKDGKSQLLSLVVVN